jgi:hypothetical protein
MAKKRDDEEPEVPDDRGARTQSIGPPPTRVYLVQAADWNGGNTALGVAEKDAWRMEPHGDGFMFFKRAPPPTGKRSFWVPSSGIRFVEFDLD